MEVKQQHLKEAWRRQSELLKQELRASESEEIAESLRVIPNVIAVAPAALHKFQQARVARAVRQRAMAITVGTFLLLISLVPAVDMNIDAPRALLAAVTESASGSWISQTLCSYFSLCSDSGAALTRAARDRAYEPVIVIEKSKAAAPAVSVQSAPSSVARVVQNITQPARTEPVERVIERIIERASASRVCKYFCVNDLWIT
ncbi:hypothetical protein HY413_02280 [Candidatus Kaiserbacteria bacterium]|nr:hypothetical protein [Candidatus Kaiserbacteria bacterium]